MTTIDTLTSLFQNARVALMNDERAASVDASTLRFVLFAGQSITDRPMTKLIGSNPSVEEMATMIREIVTRQIAVFGSADAQQPRNGYCGWIWNSALIAWRAFLPENDPLYHKLMLSALIHLGTFDHDPQWRMLPKRLHSKSIGMQDIADYLLSLGIPEDEIRSAWSQMLELRSEQGYKLGYVTCHWRGVTINGCNLSNEAEGVAKKLLLKFLTDPFYRTRDSGVNGLRAHEDLFDLLNFLFCEVNPDWLSIKLEAHSALRNYCMHFIGEGKIGFPKALYERLGHHVGIAGEDVALHISKMCEAAAQQAAESQDFGLGYALLCHIGIENKEWREKAELLGQPTNIREDFAVVTA